MASPFSMAQTIYAALSDDKTAEAKIRAESKELALAIATDPQKSFELTSSTVNGQSFSGSLTMTNMQRLKVLQLVVNMFDIGGVASKNTNPLF